MLGVASDIHLVKKEKKLHDPLFGKYSLLEKATTEAWTLCQCQAGAVSSSHHIS